MTTDTELDKVISLIKNRVISINSSNGETVIEFEGNESLSLVGGNANILNYKEPCCSFCGKLKSSVKLLAAPPDRDEPLICPECAVAYVELFASYGIEIELNISKIAPELAAQLSNMGKDLGL